MDSFAKTIIKPSLHDIHISLTKPERSQKLNISNVDFYEDLVNNLRFLRVHSSGCFGCNSSVIHKNETNVREEIQSGQ